MLLAHLYDPAGINGCLFGGHLRHALEEELQPAFAVVAIGQGLRPIVAVQRLSLK